MIQREQSPDSPGRVNQLIGSPEQGAFDLTVLGEVYAYYQATVEARRARPETT